jgi:hypothetical protein
MCFSNILLIQCKVLQRFKGPWSCHLLGTSHDCLRCIKILMNVPVMPYGQVPMQHEDCPGCIWLWLCALHHGSHGSHTFGMKGWSKALWTTVCPLSKRELVHLLMWPFLSLLCPRKGILIVYFLLSWSSCPFQDQIGWNLVTIFHYQGWTFMF